MVRKIRMGDVRTASRLIRCLEDGEEDARSAMKYLFPFTGRAHVVGITGSPGAGKSTLLDGLVESRRKIGNNIGVLAVDPTSPFTGGAILGDRIRMQRHAEDPGVFVRSLATRGALGGLSKAVGDAVHIMDVMGKDMIFVETVGTGQQEIDIINHSHTVVVVLIPGMGDGIQAIKAGIMEIADIFVVNKADKDGKERLVAEITMIVELNRKKLLWVPPLVETVATQRKGVAKLMDEISIRENWLTKNGLEVKKGKIVNQFKHMAIDRIGANILAILKDEGIFTTWTDDLIEGRSNPYLAMKELDKYLRIKWER